MVVSFEELVIAENLDRGELREWVERRWLLPTRDGERWLFAEADCARARLLRALKRDMEIDDETVPVLLSLIDQVHGLRALLETIAAAVEAQPPAVRRAILRHIDRARRR